MRVKIAGADQTQALVGRRMGESITQNTLLERRGDDTLYHPTLSFTAEAAVRLRPLAVTAALVMAAACKGNSGQHVALTSGNTTLRTYTPDYFVNWDNSVWQQYLARGSAQARNGAVSAVFDGVPYVAAQSWNPTRVNVPDLDAFLDATRSRGLLSP